MSIFVNMLLSYDTEMMKWNGPGNNVKLHKLYGSQAAVGGTKSMGI
jgi:hypothetical protein